MKAAVQGLEEERSEGETDDGEEYWLFGKGGTKGAAAGGGGGGEEVFLSGEGRALK